MRRIAILFIAALNAIIMQAGMSNSIEYGQLFIVGDATETSWDLGSAAEMPRIANGVFEWTGRLIGGKEFKFMNTREAWHKHIVSIKSDVLVEIGKDYQLNFYSNWALDGSLDCKFKIAESGDYTVVVDLTSMRMVVSKPVQTANWPEKFYLVGSATDNQIIEIPEFYGIEHKKTVKLHTGFVKLIDTRTITEQTNYYAPRFPEVDITYGQGCNVYLCAADENTNGWSVSVPGEYMVYLDNERHTISCKKYRQYSTLYLVGGCCERAWNYWNDGNNRFQQSPYDPDIMVWEGELRIGWEKIRNSDGSYSDPAEPNKFKILTAQDWFRDTYHPYKADMPVEGCTDARISGGDDLKWTIQKDGLYRLELNIKTETLKAICTQSFDTSEINNCGNAGLEDLGTLEEPTHPNYYNLQGLKICEPSTGIYIVADGNSVKKCFK